MITDTERTLLKYLGKSLKISEDACEYLNLGDEADKQLLSLADRHEVLVLLGNVLNLDTLSPNLQDYFQLKTARTVHKAITLQSVNTSITSLLQKNGIKAITLKGFAISRLYPIPEFRKTTDIDLFFETQKDVKRAGEILCENGFKISKEWHANHHFVMLSEKNETVELHKAWADEFKDKHLNKYIEKIQKDSFQHCIRIDTGKTQINVYDTAYQAFYLAVHMFSHFVGGGFGLRNLCDWVVLWENCKDKTKIEDFRKILSESGMEKFVRAINSICIKYLGLSQEKSPFAADALSDKNLTDGLLRDILDAGEFGSSEQERMVGMNGNSLSAYISEFHHQMHINFPKAGRVILFWPFLWFATLIRFLYNNKKLKRAPISAIIKKAGSRGTLIKQLTDKNL